MTFTRYSLRTFTMAAAVALVATAASAQTAAAPRPYGHRALPHAASPAEMQTRIAVLDERIAILTMDMKMFVGDMKIEAMAQLIDALVERQGVADRQARWINERTREGMDDRIDERRTPVQPREMEPDAMCSPFI